MSGDCSDHDVDGDARNLRRPGDVLGDAALHRDPDLRRASSPRDADVHLESERVVLLRHADAAVSARAVDGSPYAVDLAGGIRRIRSENVVSDDRVHSRLF